MSDRGTCPRCGIVMDPLNDRGRRSHIGSQTCLARQMIAKMRETHVEVSAWENGINPYVIRGPVDNRLHSWCKSYWVPKGIARSWCNAHGITALRTKLLHRCYSKKGQQAARAVIREVAKVAKRFGASSSKQLNGEQ